MKGIKKMLIAAFLSFAIFISLSPNKVFAEMETASFKGFETNRLEYQADAFTEYNLSTSKYKYGDMYLWSAIYTFHLKEKDTMYYIVLTEAEIESYGKNGKRYFRNKEMNVSVGLNGEEGIGNVIKYAPENATNKTYSITKGFGAEMGANTSGEVGLKTGYTFSVTEQYSAVRFEVSKNGETNGVDYNWFFKNWDNGSMTVPNKGLVRQVMVTTFEVNNYSSKLSHYINIAYDAVIFKDAKWPLSNFTGTGKINHNYSLSNYAIQESKSSNLS